ncbi:unnamed protein product [Adineta ricciae]|uniref:FLYWCH-type domain-containing protein n=1 Tax=Adineta ricciae TaxID=249248 RepID=A0A814LTZ6_ADIRI|nr:unnamed protein product [Adineta ricciae]CAF1418157.1 unnamed protein product [Adineta ricciae]
MTSIDSIISNERSLSSPSTFPITSASSPSPSIEKTTSNQHKPMLYIKGYYYQLKDFKKNKKIKFWRCAKSDCGVLLHTNLKDEFIRYSGKNTDYKHLPNPTALGTRDLKLKMRQRAETELTPLQQIAEQELRNGLLTSDALANLPNIFELGIVQSRIWVMNVLNVLFSLSRSWFKSYSTKNLPSTPNSSSFVIPDKYTRDHLDRDRLLLHDSANPQFQFDSSEDIKISGRILIWSSDIQLNLLFNSERLHMDGTFATSPPDFSQVFIIQTIRHESCTPVVYALLPGQKTSYLYLFNALFHHAQIFNKTLDPVNIMTDFEPGLTKAVSIQTIFRHVQSQGLSTTYLNNIMARNVVKQTMTLALVSPSHVQLLFNELGQELNDDERNEILDLLLYFKNYWMRQISIWNVYEIPDRTNYYSEGYNNRFKKRLQKTHPNIWHFIDSIREEVHTIHDSIQQINSGMPPRTNRSQTRTSERRIKELYC